MLVFDVVGWMDASTVVAFGGVNFWPTWKFDVNFSFGSVVLGRFSIAVVKTRLAGLEFGYMAVIRKGVMGKLFSIRGACCCINCCALHK